MAKRIIYKYKLEIADVQQILMPKGADILTIQVQNGTPCLWAMVDPDAAETEQRTFGMLATGHSTMPNGIENVYLGTIQLHGGVLVYHCFEWIR